MKYTYRTIFRKYYKPEVIYGWVPPYLEVYRDIVEDYIYLSRKRQNNKYAMFKLQMHILEDVLYQIDIIDNYLEEVNNLKKDNSISEQISNKIESQIYFHDLILAALKEVADGIAWRSFEYNRALLSVLADKPSMGVIRRDRGFYSNIREFADQYLIYNKKAILNDITNILRIGDITSFEDDNSIEFIEVKASEKQRGSRITRQKIKMQEVVTFFNTGIRDYDGRLLTIKESFIEQNNYLHILKNVIKMAKLNGFESSLVGNYMIVECFDPKRDKNTLQKALEKKLISVKKKWESNNDLVNYYYAIEKPLFALICAPYSIFPFDAEICADIICGTLILLYIVNFSQIERIFEEKGWKITKDEDDIRITKSSITLKIPSVYFARIVFELLSPFAVINHFEKWLSEGSTDIDELRMISFTDEKNIWE